MAGRLTIFAKGNVDVRDSLLVQRIGDEVVWNGINEVLRERCPGWRARVRHETCSRSDAIVAGGPVPADLRDRALPLGAYTLQSQFETQLFEEGHDAVILSLQPEVMNRMARHRGDGHLLYPQAIETWTSQDRAWFASHYVPAGLIAPDASMANLRTIIERLQEAVRHVLVYTMSPVVPGERTHSHVGMTETLSWRIRRFNMALTELSRELDFSIVDLDTLFARHGADRLKQDVVHFTPEGCRVVAEEVVEILADRGCLEP